MGTRTNQEKILSSFRDIYENYDFFDLFFKKKQMFFDLKFWAGNRPFWTTAIFYMVDGWWMVDGGWDTGRPF